jgi:glycosyltransferase involved in cell wall biosynthesis
VIVCDDGSTDMTAEIAEAIGAKVIRHERNKGYGAALASLFKAARELERISYDYFRCRSST